ncbi:superoxide dismutase [Gracilaria domingensis]|nr:superoxide dismutase [Gracilaria domingensis]
MAVLFVFSTSFSPPLVRGVSTSRTPLASRPRWTCAVAGGSIVSRRAFLTLSAAVVGAGALDWRVSADAPTAFALPDLPYSYDALQPYIREDIMRAHHDAHFAGYVKKLNVALKQLADGSVKDDAALKKLMAKLDSVGDVSLRTQIRNNGGGYLNHKQFFETMTSGGSALSNKCALAKHIDRQFGSFEKFEKEFIDTAIGLFGSGFVWLVLDSDRLRITKYANQDNPALEGDVLPVLGCDCWEHAWYYQYGPKKADYIKQWWKVVHWSRVSDIYDRKV